MKTRLRRNSTAGKNFTIFDISKKNDRDQVIAEHKSITHLEPPEYNFLRVFKTPFAGFGVIAHKTIKKNQIICSYQGETVQQEIKDGVMPRYDEVTNALAEQKKQLTQNGDRSLTEEEQEKLDEFANQRKKLIRSYAFILKQNNQQCLTVLSHRQAGIAALVNCSWNGFANAEANLENNKIVYRALRDIQPGEEILIDYGCDYTDSQEFHHIFPIGSRSIGSFLEQNARHYPHPHQSIALDKTNQALLGTQATHVLLPHYCSDSKKLESLHDTEINLLPVIEMVKQITDNKFIPLPSQQFITTLMYTCLKPELRENKTIFDKLIRKKVCVDFVTANGRSAWHILTSQYRSSAQNKICMKLSTAIYHIYDKRGWADAYPSYLYKNLKATSAENQQAIFSAILLPPKKTGYKRVNLIQEDSRQETSLSVMAETAPITETSQFDKSEEKTNSPAEIKSDIVTGPPPELKRGDSIPPLEAILLPDNKLISPSLIIQKSKPSNKRKSWDCIDLTIEPVVKKPSIENIPERELKSEADRTIDKFPQLNTCHHRKDFRGLNPVAIAVKFKQIDTLKAILQNPHINQDQIATLINTTHREGCETGLTVIDLAVKYYCEPVFTILLEEMIYANQSDLILKRQSIGEYAGCSLLAVAILKKSLSAVKTLEKIKDFDQRIALITAPEAKSCCFGMTALMLAVQQKEMKISGFLLDICGPKKLSVLTCSQTIGCCKGYNAISYAALHSHTGFFSFLIETIGKDNLFKLITQPLTDGKIKGLTPFDIAFDSSENSTTLLTLLISIIPSSQKFAMFNTPHLAGNQQGATNFAMAVCRPYFSIVKEILDNNDMDQNIALITTPQNGPFLEGLTPVSSAIRSGISATMDRRKKYRPIADDYCNLVRLLLNHLPPACRLSILNYRALKGWEKGLSAYDIAAKYRKPDGVAFLMAQIGPLLTVPKTVSIVENQMVSFNFSSQGSMTSNTTTATQNKTGTTL
jgi:hypothetical protein